MTFALILACAVTRQWRGAVLMAVAVPVAIGLTEYVLKPSVGEAIGQAFPSGHATSSFALAATFAVLLASPPCRRVPGGVRLLLALVAVLLATAVAAAMVAIGAHTSPTPWAAPRSAPAWSWPVRSPSMRWAACGSENQRRHLLTPAISTCPGRVGPEGSTMSSSPESPHLDNHHRNTLRQIFEHPVSHNIEWHAVTSLFDAIGTVTVHGGKVTITVGAERQIFDHPVGKDIDAQMVSTSATCSPRPATPPRKAPARALAAHDRVGLQLEAASAPSAVTETMVRSRVSRSSGPAARRPRRNAAAAQPPRPGRGCRNQPGRPS